MLEVAVLDRKRPRRAFRRLAAPLLTRLLAKDDPMKDVPAADDTRPGTHQTLTGDEGGTAATEPGGGSGSAPGEGHEGLPEDEPR